jgi:hypothetical protein
MDYKHNKLNKEYARKLIVKLARDGRVLFTSHAIKRLEERDLVVNDVMNVLLSESMRVSEGEPNFNGNTYRCSTRRISVVVGFNISGDGVIVITVFRADRK